ncbi:hypothetical protein C8A05DRAFT_17666 [Staphylotrichum tortipilum]|uniref:UBC core domain-containing protein n=1 Tax=Staphylotrichum tortipilum TaxID=2831512 RepID=A0AAN6RRN2_9PEZI|nr:hypothetical protein C8A05DRAFT_17666 [Staphylotrichum longicolle]
MSFKRFRADVVRATEKAASGAVFGVVDVANGVSDGEVVIKFRHESLRGDVRVHALAQDVSEYPDGNMFMLWAGHDDPPPPIVAAIKAAQDFLLGLSVYEMVTQVARHLEKEICPAFGTPADGLDDAMDSTDEVADEDDYDAAYDADYPSDGDEFGLPPSAAGRRARQTRKFSTTVSKPLLQRIKRDLRKVKNAGYKVGFLDSFGRTAASGIVSLSVRIDKLALSDEAMEAWDVKPTEYVVLLMRFEKTYDPLERALEQAASHTVVSFRIGKCAKYKPPLSQALHAFANSGHPLTADDSPLAGAEDPADDAAKFEKLFISNALEQFMCESFVSLLKLRAGQGLDWESANEHMLARIGLFMGDVDGYRPANPQAEQSRPQTPRGSCPPSARHAVLASDHLVEKDAAGERSLPLVAMQFAMRYFVKCTEYCLRCHRRLDKGFEALRPYVCSDPLCLFQYMAMGFGPSIEHEILTEPYVVDLLVSLCYSAVQPYYPRPHVPAPYGSVAPVEQKLAIRTLPVGLRIMVPDLSNMTANPWKARLEANGTRLVFEDQEVNDLAERLPPGKWLAFRVPGQSMAQHARVREVNTAARTAFIQVMAKSAAYWGTGYYAPTPDPGHPAFYNPAAATSNQADANIADVLPYDTDFDSLDHKSKGDAMRHVLDTLPSILEIEEWLTARPHCTLRSMENVSPAALSLLRWIVSSNRSCIFQVDRSRAIAWSRAGLGVGTAAVTPAAPAVQSPEPDGVAGRGRNREHERILGMDGWIQFRFAQGSPDKELRFNRALQEVAARKAIHEHPTIFAWHGSNLANWHSIVRTGLDFQDMRTGRAFGNGVYFSRQHATSIGYASTAQMWPNSDLHFTTCLSLNEVINAPDEFVSSNPHYVVSQLDWHQCRYLFVQTASGRGGRQPPKAKPADGESSSTSDQEFYPQATGREILGPDGAPLRIPLSAIPLRTVGPGPAAAMAFSPMKRTVQLLDDSDNDDGEDVAILYTDAESEDYCPPHKKSNSRASSVDIAGDRDRSAGPPTPASSSIDRALSDFEPGSLDLSTLPRLQPPSFATDAATKSLSRELVRLQMMQAKTPLHELGWYMNFDEISNLYQWIVELHSFEAALPLAQDMKAAGVRSIVLELRFGADFPFSPPFVRVVRPRFLTFLEGGGGHVTAGGAMCMELLTSSGWSPVNAMESLFLQVRLALCSLDPRPARLARGVVVGGAGRGDYGVAEAVEAYVRAAKMHGWAVPPNLRDTALGL